MPVKHIVSLTTELFSIICNIQTRDCHGNAALGESFYLCERSWLCRGVDPKVDRSLHCFEFDALWELVKVRCFSC